MEQTGRHQKHLQEALTHITSLLRKQSLVRELADKSAGPRQELVHELVVRQQSSELRREIDRMHPADIAYVLENLALGERRKLWDLVDARYDGAVLLEVSDLVRSSLIREMDIPEMVNAAEHLDSDEIADLVPDLPGEVVSELMQRLGREDREQVQSALSFSEGSVGALMEFDLIAVREGVSLDVVVRYLRRLGRLPQGVDELMVVDRDGVLRGSLNLSALLIHPGETEVAEVMSRKVISFHTNDPLEDAVGAFERYDLLLAPVVNVHDQLVGVLKVEAVLDYVHERSQRELLSQAGLKEEDLFAPVWQSAKNRGLWLALNLVTAFFASRVIGQFEQAIEQIVALAVLMPIVAAVGGNTGNQTLALVIRGYALNQISASSFRHLLYKEALIGMLNGLAWGGLMGLATLLLYRDGSLALVLFTAMLLTLSLASVIGVMTPTLLRKFGQDPAYGSSVIVTGITDSLGFFFFLGLASLMLVGV
jgi:magnesium transporter